MDPDTKESQEINYLPESRSGEMQSGMKSSTLLFFMSSPQL